MQKVCKFEDSAEPPKTPLSFHVQACLGTGTLWGRAREQDVPNAALAAAGGVAPLFQRGLCTRRGEESWATLRHGAPAWYGQGFALGNILVRRCETVCTSFLAASAGSPPAHPLAFLSRSLTLPLSVGRTAGGR